VVLFLLFQLVSYSLLDILLCGLFYLLILFFRFISNYYISIANKKFYKSCNPEPLLKELKFELENINDETRKEKLRLIYFTTQCIKRPSNDNLKKILSINKNMLNKNEITILKINLIYFYILNNQLNDAEKLISSIPDFNDNKNFERINKVYNLYIGKYKGLEEYFIKQLNLCSKSNLYGYASLNFYLGIYYYKNGNNLKAFDYFKFVKDNSKKIYLGKLAEKYIADLNLEAENE
jgi:hypothetical protein